MQVSDSKEVANHVVPEPCATHREVSRPSLTGVGIGQKHRLQLTGCRESWTTDFHNPAPFIHGRACDLPSLTQGSSRMREYCLYGSVRGAPSNGRPYRDWWGLAGPAKPLRGNYV